MEALYITILTLSSLTFITGYDLDHGVDLPTRRPLNIAHRGSSGMFPDHTAEGYRKAIEQGADIIECDVTVTRDLHLVCLHESWMNATTNVAQIFPDRWTTRIVNLVPITDYFTVDFDLAELKELGVKQRLSFRDPSYDYQLQITSLEEYIQIAQAAERPVGIYPESKDPEWINSLDIIKDANTTFEQLIVDVLHSYGYTEKTDPCFVQSFSPISILRFRQITELPLIMLNIIGFITDGMLEAWSEYCYGIGPNKGMIVEVDSETNQITSRTDLVDRAHSFGLRVHPYTSRNEYQYLPFDYGQDPYDEFQDFVDIGVDGLFTDFPHSLVKFLEWTDTSEPEDKKVSKHVM